MPTKKEEMETSYHMKEAPVKLSINKEALGLKIQE